MEPLDESDTPFGHAFDEREVPKWARPCQGNSHEIGAELSKFDLISRRCKSADPYMISYVEFGIIDP